MAVYKIVYERQEVLIQVHTKEEYFDGLVGEYRKLRKKKTPEGFVNFLKDRGFTDAKIIKPKEMSFNVN